MREYRFRDLNSKKFLYTRAKNKKEAQNAFLRAGFKVSLKMIQKV
jgi:hypothetical protein